MTARGHIYMIRTPLDNSFCYIGSTFNRLHKRFVEHKSRYKIKNGLFSIHKYFDKYGVDNFKIDLIKTYNVVRTHDKDRKHLEAYETLWINKTKNCINKISPFNPVFKMKEFIKQNSKKCYENNKSNYPKYCQKYHLNNKDKVHKRKNTKIECECGGKYTKSNKKRHLKTMKHKNYIANLDNSI